MLLGRALDRVREMTVEEELVTLLYDELHALAKHYMAQERAGHTLQTTALVNEAYTTPPVGDTTLAEGRTRMPSKCLVGGTNATLWMQPAEVILDVQADRDLAAPTPAAGPRPISARSYLDPGAGIPWSYW